MFGDKCNSARARLPGPSQIAQFPQKALAGQFPEITEPAGMNHMVHHFRADREYRHILINCPRQYPYRLTKLQQKDRFFKISHPAF